MAYVHTTSPQHAHRIRHSPPSSSTSCLDMTHLANQTTSRPTECSVYGPGRAFRLHDFFVPFTTSQFLPFGLSKKEFIALLPPLGAPRPIVHICLSLSLLCGPGPWRVDERTSAVHMWILRLDAAQRDGEKLFGTSS